MANFTMRSSPQPPPLRIEPFRGINLSVTPTQIDDNQSPSMLNVNISERGALNKRKGYTRVLTNSIGLGRINGMHLYKKKDGTSIFLFSHGTKLYKTNDELGGFAYWGEENLSDTWISNITSIWEDGIHTDIIAPIELYSSLSNNDTTFFEMNDKCYIMDGTNYLVFDGNTIAPVNPYIPTITISNKPNGGGEKHEDFNLLGAGFKETFSGDGTTKEYQLSLKPIDATPVIVKVNEELKTFTTDYTVNITTGKITFVTAPPTGTNNVEITAYKAQSGFPDRIKKCTLQIKYGGSNDTRLFVSGNPDMPEYVWVSGLYDPTYYPENGFYKYPDRVKGFSKQYDTLLIHRENGMHQTSFELTAEGKASFPSKPINDRIGTLSPKTIQIIENNPVMVSKEGVYTLVSSSVRDERNVAHISGNIDLWLMNETNLNELVSIDYDRKYWLAVNGNVYVLDYTQKSADSPFGEWFVYNNIPASCFIEIDGVLYFGSSKEGLIYKFDDSFNDDGQPIKAHWKSKPFTFNADEFRKYVDSLYLGIKPSGKTSVDVSYETDLKKTTIKGSKPIQFNLFSFKQINFNNFSFKSTSFHKTAKIKIKAKKITHFQLTLSNDKLDESLTILSMAIKYRYQGQIK
ncbi:phage tail fiber protein [Fictibacillus sp. JL2B1089]|uniref:phage tail fiber domain-containing protein n=1 Tax=Fictibacillus sp. JL2B1089 TaxID=3399565 RepID=UPI003A840F65